MSRTVLIIITAAVLALAVIAGAVALVSTSGDSPKSRYPSTSERAPEAENHSVGELPAVERAARSFLADYLPLIYAQRGASIDKLRSTAPKLVAQLKADPGRVPPGQAALHPNLERVTVTLDSPSTALAVAQIRDSPSFSYPLTFQLEKTAQGWLVTHIGDA